jgi:hypothetical protein
MRAKCGNPYLNPYSKKDKNIPNFSFHSKVKYPHLFP